MFQVDIS